MNELLEQIRATSPWEAIGAALGLAYLLLAVKRNLLCWFCAFASTAIYLVLFLQASLYMHVALHVFYLAMAVYGFVEWSKGKTPKGDVAIASWTPLQHMSVALLVAAATALNGWLLAANTDAVAPYVDSFVTWGSVVTTWMVARRVIENWLYWVVVDGVAAVLYYSQEMYWTALLFVLYVIIVIRGYFVWRREQREQRAAVPGSPAAAAST